MNTNVAYIPVRGGSKSIPLKNIKPIAGKPLIYWAAKAANDCKEIDAVYICTDSDEISNVVAGFNFTKARIIGRSAESATDTAPTELGMIEFVNKYEATNIALIQSTSPLITAKDLSDGFKTLALNGVDSVLSVVRQKRFIWEDGTGRYAHPVNYDYANRPRRQEFNGFLVENGAFYMTSRDSLLKSRCRLSGNIKTIEMPPESYIELDEPEDWLIVEYLLERRR